MAPSISLYTCKDEADELERPSQLELQEHGEADLEPNVPRSEEKEPRRGKHVHVSAFSENTLPVYLTRLRYTQAPGSAESLHCR